LRSNASRGHCCRKVGDDERGLRASLELVKTERVDTPESDKDSCYVQLASFQAMYQERNSAEKNKKVSGWGGGGGGEGKRVCE